MFQKVVVLLWILLALEPWALGAVGHGDFSGLSFTASFDSLFANFSTCYPFTEWKAIDWQELYDCFAPQIQTAQDSQDTLSFKMVLRRFIHSFPDGHVRISGEFGELYMPEIGGGFGFTLIELDDGSFVVDRIHPGSPAALAGIRIGAVITQWDGRTIDEALEDQDIVWEGKPPATLEGVRLAKLRRLARAAVGASVSLTWTNPNESSTIQTLIAEDDAMMLWTASNRVKFDTNGKVKLTYEDLHIPVEHRILPGGYGYVKNRILVQLDSQGNINPFSMGIYDSLKSAIDGFSAARVPGVIVDIRDNPGGLDRLAALFGSFFYDHSELYEHASFYNPETEQFELVSRFTIYLEPQSSRYLGPVVCLINSGTSSSAEGVAMAIQRTEQGFTLGMSGTNGSFGLTSGETLLPSGLVVNYPIGRSLDQNYTIQVDSDADLAGGILPDIRVPVRMETVLDAYTDTVDVELNAAIAFLDSLTFNDPDRPSDPVLFPNYPNPFNGSTEITYYLPLSMHVRLSIVNLLGQDVVTLLDGVSEAGYHSSTWSGANRFGEPVGSGVYFFQLKTEHSICVRKIILMR